jgi:uncharacterized protein YjbI with pentapeptide repeats
MAQDALANPNEAVAAPASSPDRKAIDACVAAARLDDNGTDLAEMAARLRNPDNRIDGEDWSGQDLSGRNFVGKALVNVKLKGAILHGAVLTDAVICESDLSNADLTGAHLDRVIIADGTQLDGANFSKVSARDANIANAFGAIRVDGADLRGASTLCDELPQCVAGGIQFSSVAGADLRGASLRSLCCLSNLGAAKLDGVTYRNPWLGGTDTDLAQLAAGLGNAGRITFLPAYGYSATRTEFTGQELRQIAALLPGMQTASARPSFDCTRAGTSVEKAVCRDAKLAALDSAMSWLWDRVEHTSVQQAAQKKWLASRADCTPADQALPEDSFYPGSFMSPADPKGCIGRAYAERIKQLGSSASQIVVGNGTYTTDPPP